MHRHTFHQWRKLTRQIQTSHKRGSLLMKWGRKKVKILWLMYTPIKSNITYAGWFQIGKGVRQGCILSPCLFNLYAEYIMRNAGLEEAQTGIKIAGRNINNLRYAGDTTLPYGRK